MSSPIVYEHVSPHAREIWNVWEEIKPQISWHWEQHWISGASLRAWESEFYAVPQIISSLFKLPTRFS